MVMRKLRDAAVFVLYKHERLITMMEYKRLLAPLLRYQGGADVYTGSLSLSFLILFSLSFLFFRFFLSG